MPGYLTTDRGGEMALPTNMCTKYVPYYLSSLASLL